MSWLVPEPLRTPLDPIPLLVPVAINVHRCYHSVQLSGESNTILPHFTPVQIQGSFTDALTALSGFHQCNGAPFSVEYMQFLVIISVLLKAAGHLEAQLEG